MVRVTIGRRRAGLGDEVSRRGSRRGIVSIGSPNRRVADPAAPVGLSIRTTKPPPASAGFSAESIATPSSSNSGCAFGEEWLLAGGHRTEAELRAADHRGVTVAREQRERRGDRPEALSLRCRVARTGGDGARCQVEAARGSPPARSSVTAMVPPGVTSASGSPGAPTVSPPAEIQPWCGKVVGRPMLPPTVVGALGRPRRGVEGRRGPELVNRHTGRKQQSEPVVARGIVELHGRHPRARRRVTGAPSSRTDTPRSRPCGHADRW